MFNWSRQELIFHANGFQTCVSVQGHTNGKSHVLWLVDQFMTWTSNVINAHIGQSSWTLNWLHWPQRQFPQSFVHTLYCNWISSESVQLLKRPRTSWKWIFDFDLLVNGEIRVVLVPQDEVKGIEWRWGNVTRQLGRPAAQHRHLLQSDGWGINLKRKESESIGKLPGVVTTINHPSNGVTTKSKWLMERSDPPKVANLLNWFQRFYRHFCKDRRDFVGYR